MAGILDEINVQGDFLVVQTIVAVERVVGAQQGTILAVGPLVTNFAQGPVLEVGDEIVFRNGTPLKVDPDMQFLRMQDVLAVLKSPEELPPA